MDSISTAASMRVAGEEARLLALIAAGDRDDPLVELYSRYGKRVYGLGLRLLGDQGLAEDLVQETFLRLWRSAPRFDPGRATVRTFLFTIARRAAVDLWRRRDKVDVAGYESEPLVDDEAFQALLVSLDVREALDELSAKHREVLELHYRRDLTQQQISERLDVPLGTVKTRTYHALRALKHKLEERQLRD
jgi:RNA polymerase sigma-70 factor (ECF subfamily)